MKRSRAFSSGTTLAAIILGVATLGFAAASDSPVAAQAASTLPQRAVVPLLAADSAPRPSVLSTVTFDLDPSLTKEEAASLKSALAEEISRAEAGLGLAMPKLTLTAYRDPGAVAAKRAAWDGFPPQPGGQWYSCDWCAEAMYGAVFVRIGSGSLDKPSFPIFGRETLAHELFHIFQFQIAFKDRNEELLGRSAPPTQVRVVGPTWIIEGSAHRWARRAGADYLNVPFADVLASQRKQMANDPVPLGQMETGAGFNSSNNPYGTSLVAVDYLVRDRPTAIIEFYSAIGRGQSWQTAFMAAFGVPLSTFYEQFAAYRAAAPR
jgi:hypothetical protein